MGERGVNLRNRRQLTRGGLCAGRGSSARGGGGRNVGLGGERQLLDELVEGAVTEGFVVGAGEAFVEVAQDGVDGIEALP